MNQSNPVVDLQVNINANKSSIIKYPVKIYCIVDDLSAASKDRLIRDIKAHTIHSGAIFITREYDSQKFSNDRDVIQRLPAFHAYINKGYNRTFYANTRPLDHINECINIYLNNEEVKAKRKERWRKLYESFKNWIKRFGRRETAMQRYEREQSFSMVDTSRLESIKKNIVPISDWN
jgi:hypothetical protein